MRRLAGRLQAVGAGTLVLAATVAAPALSPAQDAAAPPVPAPVTPTPPAPPVPDPATESQAEPVAPVQSQAVTAPAPAATDRSAAKPNVAKLAATKTVAVGDNFYTPATISITAGDTITWKNNGAAPHSATADDGSFDTGVFNGGQSRSETFSTAGTIPYFCTVHGQAQSGTIQVRAASGGSGGGGNNNGGGGSSNSTGTSEAAAVSSPSAAGSSTSLPATGFFAIALFAIGFGLVGSGSYLKRLEERLTSSASS